MMITWQSHAGHMVITWQSHASLTRWWVCCACPGVWQSSPLTWGSGSSPQFPPRRSTAGPSQGLPPGAHHSQGQTGKTLPVWAEDERTIMHFRHHFTYVCMQCWSDLRTVIGARGDIVLPPLRNNQVWNVCRYVRVYVCSMCWCPCYHHPHMHTHVPSRTHMHTDMWRCTTMEGTHQHIARPKGDYLSRALIVHNTAWLIGNGNSNSSSSRHMYIHTHIRTSMHNFTSSSNKL